jgi:tetratricopeptide (TPR) repeat protein
MTLLGKFQALWRGQRLGSSFNEWMPALSRRRASPMRELLRDRLGPKSGALGEEVLKLARGQGWSQGELAKLEIYVQAFTGQVAQAYQRLLASESALEDFELFMTVLTQCYLHDRFAEGYQLLKAFDPIHAQDVDLAEFYPSAAYAAYNGGGTVAEAADYILQAITEGIDSPLLAVNGAVILLEHGDLEQLHTLMERLYRQYIHDVEAVYALAYIALARGYYPEGFRLMEVRYQRQEIQQMMRSAFQPGNRWAGEPLQGIRLLLHGEQGIGDLLMMARYIPALERQGATVIAECDPVLRSLLVHNFPNCEFLDLQPKVALTVPFDRWIGIMSLPFFLGTTTSNVPSTSGYLSAPPEHTHYWRDLIRSKFDAQQPKIGVAWSGNPRHRFDLRRSIPADVFLPYLRSWSGVQFFALQTALSETLPSHVAAFPDELVTFADTAAIVSELDAVVCVDTSLVHLAGALGKPTWLLLPRRYEWRWSLDGEANSWYESVRVVRQNESGQWKPVLDEMFSQRLPDWLSQQHAGVPLQTLPTVASKPPLSC